MGTFTLLASGLVTGGIGPWLPYQMFTAGWAGLSAGWLGQASQWVREQVSRPAHLEQERRTVLDVSHGDVIVLCSFGFVWGLLYGAIMNIYFWPFAVGPAAQTWEAGIGLGETLARYGVFYVVTSLAWDLARAVGNVALMLALAKPMIKALHRFQRRFHFQVQGSRPDLTELESHA
jgi:energy-coupling factor transport system substrate-specific component